MEVMEVMEVQDEHVAVKMSEYKEKLQSNTLLTCFDHLSADNEKIRINSAMKLLRHLSQNSNHDTNKKEAEYSLTRLIRGLSSSRETSRSGYYTTFVGFLSLLQIKTISISELIQLIKKELHCTGNDSKSEIGDLSFGKINACGAIIHSKVFERASPDEQKSILELIITASKQKSFLQLPAYIFLTNCLMNISEESFKSILWPVMRVEVGKQWSEQNMDLIRFILVAQERFPKVVNNKFIKESIGTTELLTTDSVTYLSDMMMLVPRLKTIENPFYEIFCRHISKSNVLVEFWGLIDNHLQKPTRNKEIISTTILIHILQNIENTTVIPELMTAKFIELLLNRAKLVKRQKRDDLNIKITLLFKTLTEKLTKGDVKSKTKLKVLKKLILSPGDFMFEKITGSKVCQHIILSLDASHIKKLATILQEIILVTRERETTSKRKIWFNSERLHAVHLLSKLLSLSPVVEEHEWRLEQLKFFINISLFSSVDGKTICQKDEGNVGSELADAIKICFYNSLTYKFKKLEDLRSILSGLVSYINDQIKDDGLQRLRSELSEEIVESWNNMYVFIKKLENKNVTSDKENAVLPVFHTLFLTMGLHLFNSAKLAKNSLLELQSCYDRLQTPKKKKKRRELKEGDYEAEEPEWIEVVVDWFLSILSKESSLLRTITSCVFPHLCSLLNATSIHQILNVLDPKNEDNEDYMDESDPDSGSSDEEENESSSNNEDDEEEASDTDDEDDYDKNMDVEEDYDEYDEKLTEKLRVSVSQALGKAATETDQESIDIDDIDEEEGKRIDAELTKAFSILKSSRSGKNRKQSKEDAALTHFRIRVLDLIEIYLENEPSMYLCLEIMLPLIQTFEFCIRDRHQEPLQNRVHSCVKKLTVIKKFSTTESVTPDLLANMLKSVIDKGSKSVFICQAMSDIVTECCTFIVRCSLIVQPITATPNKKTKSVEYSAMGEVYKNALLSFFTTNECVLPITLFKCALNLVWMDNWLLAECLVECVFNFKLRPFRRSQALELLTAFYNSRLLTFNLKKTKKLLHSIETNFADKAISLLNGKYDKDLNEKAVNETFFGNLVAFLTLVKRYHKNGTLKEVPDVIDWQEVAEAVQKCRQNIIKLGKTAKNAYKIFCREFNLVIENPSVLKNGIAKQKRSSDDCDSDGDTNDACGGPKKKRKMSKESSLNISLNSAGNDQTNDGDESSMAEQDDEDSEIIPVGKKRQRSKAISKNTILLKKEAQELRIKAASQGLETVKFSQIDIYQIGNEENSTTSSDEEQDVKKNNNMSNGTKINSTKNSIPDTISTKKLKKK